MFYRDRRNSGSGGLSWLFRFDRTSGNLLSWTDPLDHQQSLAYEQVVPPDAMTLWHEPTRYTNALGKQWLAHYDYSGNVLWSEDPLAHRTTFTHDGLNNVTSVTPPGATEHTGNPYKTVTYTYDTSGPHPTSPTAITQLPAETGGDPGVTTMEYYGPADSTPYGDGAWNGLVKRVTPPYEASSGNPVATEYKYDQWGQLHEDREGPPTGQRTPPQPIITQTANNAVGWPTGERTGESGGAIGHDDNGNIIAVYCVWKLPNLQEGGLTAWTPIASCEKPDVDGYWATFTADPYTRMGRPTRFVLDVQYESPGWEESSTREQTFQFDNLGLMTTNNRSTTEPAWNQGSAASLQRGFTYTRNLATGVFDRSGPDGQVSHTLTDVAGRVTTFTRGAISGTMSYYADNRVDTIIYGNDTRTKYTYGDAGRTDVIRHETTAGVRIQELDYDWTEDGLVNQITETDELGQVSATVFTYDNWNRLTQEVRTGQHQYNLAYYYDLAGNRTQKVDALNNIVVDYVYDVSDPDLYGSQGNRLMSSVTRQAGQVVEERWYTYDKLGRADFVIRRLAGDVDELGVQWYRGTRLWYAKAGQVWLTRSERWQLDEYEQAVNCEPLSAMEYRHDSPRARYLVRPRDPATLQPYAADDGTWYDYDGDDIYGDFTVSYDSQTQSLSTENVMAHEPGVAEYDFAAGELHYLHGNLIGTTERLTDGSAAIIHRAVYTAFGEPIYKGGTGVPPVDTRYGYAGAYGYQSASSQEPADPLAELGWLHVGHRYYDPSSGRFLQRDPIGIDGGLNVYEYVSSNPAEEYDPHGLLSPHGVLEMGAVYRGWREAGRSNEEAAELTRQWALETGIAQTCTVLVAPLVGPAAGHPAVQQSLKYVRRYVRVECHPIPGYRNYGPVWHVNVRKAHIIIDPRVWRDRLKRGP